MILGYFGDMWKLKGFSSQGSLEVTATLICAHYQPLSLQERLHLCYVK